MNPILGVMNLGIWNLLFVVFWGSVPPWGFYAHRIINQQAVFSLPPELLKFYKHHIDYLQEHAVDPDKRRYASEFEAVRHYIDLDHWGSPPFENLTRNFRMDVKHHLQWKVKAGEVLIPIKVLLDGQHLRWVCGKQILGSLSTQQFDSLYHHLIWLHYYDQPWSIKSSELFENNLLNLEFLIEDGLSPHGIIPYFLPVIQANLTKAFESKDLSKILKISAEIGHYIADATVPLHTTQNYNGQLSGQNGIHAFWETQIPELLLESRFNLWADQAIYIRSIDQYYWKIVLESHRLVPEVFETERQVRDQFTKAEQYCYEWRNNQLAKMNCRELITAFYHALKGQVDDRMRLAISAVASSWYTAWTDAGQPQLTFENQD
jgi:hypothetical protein